MRESFTYGSVGEALGNQCFYPEADRQDRAAFGRRHLIVSLYIFRNNPLKAGGC